ncbi:MAG: HAMP domain-containing sensor histidine kinase [Acidobacteriota bacterium]|nr:HAMP domain-containing sensor histidine kinase [Acidobacteriota bacterium]
MARGETASPRRRKARNPLQVNLRWLVYLILLAVIVPTTLVTGVGVAVMTSRDGPRDLIFGILVTAFALSVIAGAFLLLVLAWRGARLARIQETFLSHMGHELLTPLAGIRLHTQILEQHDLPPVGRASLRSIARETSRLQELVQRILRWREIRSSADLYRRRRTTAGEIVQQVRRLLPESSRVKIRIASPRAPLRGDPESLAEAVINLISNALKYSADPKPVELAVRQLAGRVIFVVSDRGPGLPSENRSRIFEPFQRRIPAGVVDPGGSGLGLAIASQIAIAHRGKLGALDRRGGGTRFYIHVPLDRSP